MGKTSRRSFLKDSFAVTLSPVLAPSLSNSSEFGTPGQPIPASNVTTRRPTDHHPVSLENGLIKSEFDSRTGSLVELTNKNTGRRFQGRVELSRSFQLVVPLPDRQLNLVEGTRQEPPDFRKRTNGSALEFVWNGVKSEHGGMLDIQVKSKIELRPDGLNFSLCINNRSPYVVESAVYPIIGDLERPLSGILRRANSVYDHLEFSTLYPTFANEQGYWGAAYPIQLVNTPESPFILILDDQEGLYAGWHETIARELVAFTFHLRPGYTTPSDVPRSMEIDGQPVNLEFGAAHFPFINPMESRELSSIVVKPFSGDWHRGVDYYKQWRKTWMKRPTVPAWLEAVHSWQQIQANTLGDTLRIPYRDLVSYGEDCVKHRVKAIQLTGWTLDGQDGRVPIVATDPRLGTWDDLKEAIAKVQAMGVQIILYEKYNWNDIGTGWYKHELHDYASKDIFGNIHQFEGYRYDTPAHLSGINIRPLAWMCLRSRAYRKVALDQVGKSLLLNANGILLDECASHGNALYCYDRTHGHHIPAFNFLGDSLFGAELENLLKEKKSNLLLAGEAPYDLQNRYYMLSYTRTMWGHVPSMRYIDPFLPIMNAVIGYDDRETINLCLLYRYIISYEPRDFRGRLEEFPLTLEYGKKVDFLRQKFHQYLWDAEFQDTVGASVTSEGGQLIYSVFRNPRSGKKAVVLVNNHSLNPIRANICVERKTGWVLATPENPNARESQGRVSVSPRSAAVLMEL
jgi:Domain of unknown function (DUF6259)